MTREMIAFSQRALVLAYNRPLRENVRDSYEPKEPTRMKIRAIASYVVVSVCLAPSRRQIPVVRANSARASVNGPTRFSDR